MSKRKEHCWKGFSRHELNCFMKQKGLYARWQQIGHSDANAVRLLIGDKSIPEGTRKRNIDNFLAYVINGKKTRTMLRMERLKERLNNAAG